MKWKTSKAFKHRCPELRGARNPNQAHFHCPLAVPIRRSSMPEHRGFRMENLGRNIKFLIFFEMTVKIQISSISRAGGQRPKRPFHPFYNSLWEQPVDHVLRSGDYGFCLKVYADYGDKLSDIYVILYMWGCILCILFWFKRGASMEYFKSWTICHLGSSKLQLIASL